MTLLGALLITAGAGVAGAAVMLWIRAHSPAGGWFRDTQRSSGILSVIGAAFAIMLGIVVLVTFQRYTAAKEHAADEAASTAAMFESEQLFPRRDANALGALNVCYSRAVVHLDWPAMRNGDESAVVSDWATRIERRGDMVRPVGPIGDEAFKSWLDERAQRNTERRGRLLEGERVVPPIMWILMCLSGAVLLGYVLFCADPLEHARTQALSGGGVALVVVGSLLAVQFLNEPFEDEAGNIHPSAMQHALKRMEGERATLHEAIRPPCDVHGHPAA